MSTMSTAGAEPQVGCFTSLFPFNRRRKVVSATVAPAAEPTQQIPLPASEIKTIPTKSVSCTHQHGEELPSYAEFANTCMFCDYTVGRGVHVYDKLPSYGAHTLEGVFRPEVLKTIEETVDKYDSELRDLSLDILHHPEIAWQEKHTHDKLTAFMSSHGFDVTPHYLSIPTAWRAVFSHTSSSASADEPRVIGVNSEMDALPGVGHACGHNLIAIAGVGVALAIKAALEKHDVSGKIVLLGTPAEEGGGGKISLLDAGAYDEMDACIMCHPGGGAANYASIGPSLASQPLEIEFIGHGAHAAWAPWEAQNALDAAFLAYSSVSVLRQQIKPTHRVHGIVSGKDWAPNIIPDNAKMRWIVRAPTWGEVEVLRERVKACFEAAAHATGCKLEMSIGIGYYDNRQNKVLGTQYAEVVGRYGITAIFDDGMAASTDFGNVTYALPALHPNFTIPTEPNGGNHTPQFTKAAGTPEAHRLTIKTIKALALTGFRVVDDTEFAIDAKKAWEDQMASVPRGHPGLLGRVHPSSSFTPQARRTGTGGMTAPSPQAVLSNHGTPAMAPSHPPQPPMPGADRSIIPNDFLQSVTSQLDTSFGESLFGRAPEGLGMDFERDFNEWFNLDNGLEAAEG